MPQRSLLPLIGALLLAIAPVAATELKFEHVVDIGSDGVSEGRFKYVEDFAFSKDGHLLSTDASHAWVQVFDKSGRYLGRFGGKGDDDDNLEKPEGIAVDPTGNIFVADYITGFVKKYDASYKWLLTFSEYGSGKGQNMKSEFLDIRDGRLYLPETGNHRVDVFDLNGRFLFDFGSLGAAPGQFNTPEAAKFNSEGKLYVSDLKNDRVQIFDKDGKFLSAFGRTGIPPWESSSRPRVSLSIRMTMYTSPKSAMIVYRSLTKPGKP